jgi:DNA-binding NarL/FixJ family response regulator
MRAGTIARRPGVFKGTFTAADLMEEDLPPVRWAVPGILPEGLSLLAGKPKLGKSWLALGLAVAKASGGVALGKIPVERGEVLYLALEDNRRRLQNRLRKVLDGSAAPEGLHIATEWARVDEGGAEALDDWLAVHPDAGLVVVDILKVVRPRVSGNRGIYDADYEALQSMQKLAGTHGVTVLVVHHTRKMAASDPVDEVSGSTGLSGGADGIMVLKRDRGKADAYLHVTGREVEEEAELALRWDAGLASWTLAGDAEEYRLSQERRSLIEVLGAAGGGMSPKDIAEGLGKSVGSVKVLLGEMVKAGQVSNPSYGKYVLPDDAPYSAYPAYPSNGDGGKSKQSKESKRDEGRASGVCVHGFAGGAGCYLCDPEHLYRREGGSA